MKPMYYVPLLPELYDIPYTVHTIFKNVFVECSNDTFCITLKIIISFIQSLFVYLLTVVYKPGAACIAIISAIKLNFRY